MSWLAGTGPHPFPYHYPANRIFSGAATAITRHHRRYEPGTHFRALLTRSTLTLFQHADILSDLAAALAGSIGIAPTSNLDPTRQNPSMFEPIHGSAFDITGKGIANPVGTFWTAAEMLRWLGEETAADKLLDCVENVCGNGVMTKDLGGDANTKQVTDAVCEEIKRCYA